MPPESFTIPVYVPNPDAPTRRVASQLAHVDQGSAIVGHPVLPQDFESPVFVFYEGNRYANANVVTFADRCRVATGRARENASTVAKMLVRCDAVYRVGTYHAELGRVEILGGLELYRVADWLGMNLEEHQGEPRLYAELLHSAAAGGTQRSG